MRIAFSLHTELLPGAGAPTAVTALAAALDSRGHQTSLLTLSDVPRRLPERLRGVLFPAFVAQRFASNAGRIDVIDASTGDAWLYGLLRKADGPLLVTHSHGLEHAAHDALMADVARGGQAVSWKYPIYNGGLRLWEVRQSLARSDLCLFLSDHNREYAIERLNIDAQRCHVLPNGCDDRLLDRMPTMLASGDGIGIAMIGSYYAGKGVAYAARALDIVMRKHPDTTITFLGTGCPAADVRADYDASLHDRIAVVPRYDRATLPELLEDRQILLFPSLTEGFPLSLIEGMACGLAPVVSSLPGTVGIVANERDALLLPPASVEPIVSALERLIDQPETLLRLRHAARRTAMKYRWADIAEGRESLYLDFIARRRHADKSG